MSTKINKHDLLLIIIIVLVSGIFILINKLNSKDGNIAKVYYDSKLIKTIDLSKNKEYTFKGYNGEVKIKVKDKKIKVIEEKSPKHLCSKQGYISKSYETIVCLPNKIVIEIDDQMDIDTVVR